MIRVRVFVLILLLGCISSAAIGFFAGSSSAKMRIADELTLKRVHEMSIMPPDMP